MASRNIEAIEYKGVIYLKMDDLQKYLLSLTMQARHPVAKDAFEHVLYQLATIRGNQPTTAQH